MGTSGVFLDVGKNLPGHGGFRLLFSRMNPGSTEAAKQKEEERGYNENHIMQWRIFRVCRQAADEYLPPEGQGVYSFPLFNFLAVIDGYGVFGDLLYLNAADAYLRGGGVRGNGSDEKTGQEEAYQEVSANKFLYLRVPGHVMVRTKCVVSSAVWVTAIIHSPERSEEAESSLWIFPILSRSL